MAEAHRRGFGLVVGAGLAVAALAAVAGHQPWAHGSTAGGFGELTTTVEAGRVPAANAFALVVLACWGVLLVTRGVVRRVVAGIAVAAACGLVAAVVVGYSTAPDHVRDAYRDLGVDHPDAGLGGWFWVAAATALATLLTTVAAVRLVPGWPEMGRKYDAPAGSTPAKTEPAPPEERDNLDLWKSMDEGRDPTA